MIPSQFKRRRLKWLTIKIGSGKTPKGGAEIYSDSGVVFLRSQNIHFHGVSLEDAAFISVDVDQEMESTRVREGDALLNITGASLGRATYVPQGFPRANVNQHVCIIRPSAELDSRFLAACLASDLVQQQIFSQQVGGNRDGLNFEQVGDLVILAPPRVEQERIADFLDAETGKLDAMVRAQERLLDVLGERVDNKILEIIGNSRLADSTAGNPLIPLRRLLTKVFRPATQTNEVITAFRDGQVTARSLRRAEGYTNSASTDPQGQHVIEDDVVVHGLDGFAGAIGTSEAEGNCSPIYHVLVPKGGGDPLYYGRLLRILALQGYLTGFSYSTRERAFDFRNWDMFGRIPIPVAAVQEQHAIGQQIRKLRPLRKKTKEFTEVAKERRQALITAAVTGQFDVSTASGRGIEV